MAGAFASEREEKKYTLRLGPEAVRDVEWLAQKLGSVSFAEVFKRSIATEKYLIEQQEAGDVIILENKRTGRQRELALRLG